MQYKNCPGLPVSVRKAWINAMRSDKFKCCYDGTYGLYYGPLACGIGVIARLTMTWEQWKHTNPANELVKRDWLTESEVTKIIDLNDREKSYEPVIAYLKETA